MKIRFAHSAARFWTATALSLLLSTGPSAGALTVRHELGLTQIGGVPKRVVALGPHSLDLLLDLGIQPVGYAENKLVDLGSLTPGQPFTDIPYVGPLVTGRPVSLGNPYAPNLELIASLKPDLIVGDVWVSQVYPQLSKMAPTLLFEDMRPGTWKTTIRTLGQVLGREVQAQQSINGYTSAMAQARQALNGFTKNKQVLLFWTYGLQGRSEAVVVHQNDFASQALRDMGFKLSSLPVNLGEESIEGVALSLESLPSINPDAVLMLYAAKARPEDAQGKTLRQLEQEWYNLPITKNMTATKTRQVYAFDYHPLGRMRGPHGAKIAAEQLIKMLGTKK